MPYPTSLDNLTNPDPTDLISVDHSQQHGNANDAIEALEAKVGIDSSADTDSLDYKTTNHIADTSNPHGVTKSQVNLGNADNTSDTNKPVSTAQQTALDLKANIVQETWHEIGAGGEPAFENSWVNFGSGYSTAAFMKDNMGFVHLKGNVKSGTLATTAFTLPVGYRPSLDMTFVCYAYTTEIVVGVNYITSAGLVMPYFGSNIEQSLDGITFKAE